MLVTSDGVRPIPATRPLSSRIGTARAMNRYSPSCRAGTGVHSQRLDSPPRCPRTGRSASRSSGWTASSQTQPLVLLEVLPVSRSTPVHDSNSPQRPSAQTRLRMLRSASGTAGSLDAGRLRHLRAVTSVKVTTAPSTILPLRMGYAEYSTGNEVPSGRQKSSSSTRHPFPC